MSASSASLRSVPWVLSCLLAPTGAVFGADMPKQDELERVVVTANREEQLLSRVD